MANSPQTDLTSGAGKGSGSFRNARPSLGFAIVAAWSFVLALAVGGANAQVNVVTAHNDIARTGQNLNETILTPTNVSTTQFGKLFTQTVSGTLEAQPLYVSQLAIPGNGTHNVVYAATSIGYVYAFD